MSCLYGEISESNLQIEPDFSPNDAASLRYVNPQYTDKRYFSSEDSQSSTVSSEFLPPSPSKTKVGPFSNTRRFVDTTASYDAGPLSASSASSFDSSPTCTLSSSGSIATSMSSRRSSMIYQDPNRHHSSDTSPTPAGQAGLLKDNLDLDRCTLGQGLYLSHTASNDTFDFQCGNAQNASFMPIKEFPGHIQIGLGEHDHVLGDSLAYPLYAPGAPPAFLSTEMLNDSSTARLGDYALNDSQHHQASIYEDVSDDTLDLTSPPTPRSLDHSFGETPSFEDIRPQPLSVAKSDPARWLRSTKSKILKTKTHASKPHRHRNWSYLPENVDNHRGKKNECRIFDRKTQRKCDRYFERPEHLSRHQKSVHVDEPEMFPCVFKDCKDKEDKRKAIKGRNDNFKAHLKNTHFKYGATEKTGKNKRKSMKESVEAGTRDRDFRWDLLLDNQLTTFSETGETKHIWKMIGYSILETRNLRVKDIAPEWSKGPDNTMLEELDCRWIALKNGTLTYEQAMSIGNGMIETPAQGLLGVTMSQTEQMGIKNLDPRWKRLKNGQMSIEDSINLEVKDLNPVWIAQQARGKHRSGMLS